MIWLAAACTDGSDPPPGVEPVEVSAPTITANPSAGLTAWLDVSLSAAREIRVTVSNGDRSWTVSDPVATDHHLLLTGFRADQSHPITVDAVDEQGRVAGSASSAYTGPPLPDDFVPYVVPVAQSDQEEPGVTLLGLGNYLTAFDPQGFPIWYVPIQGSIHEANRLANGDLFVIVNRQTVTRLDLSGVPLAVYRAARTFDEPFGSIAVDADALHHDLIELPNGDFAALSIERRWIEDYPSSETSAAAPPEAAWVAGDVVVEFTPEGVVVQEVHLLDVLEPRRIGYDSVNGNYWEDFSPWKGDDIKDWSHANALSYDPVTDTMLVGLRHQDAIVGLDWTTGALSWIVAPTATWPPWLADKVLVPDVGAFEFAYHEHGAKFSPSGTVVLFDNGNNRASPFSDKLPDEENYSRALELALDPAHGTYHPLWTWGQDLAPSHFSGSLGDVDVLPTTDHVLVTFGNLGNPVLGGVEVDEVTRDGEVVFQLLVDYPDATTFRAERVSGLFPGL